MALNTAEKQVVEFKSKVDALSNELLKTGAFYCFDFVKIKEFFLIGLLLLRLLLLQKRRGIIIGGKYSLW